MRIGILALIAFPSLHALTPTDLTVNGNPEPLLKLGTPHLSWKFDPKDPQSTRQTAWELQLAKEPETFTTASPPPGTFWTTGKIQDDESIFRPIHIQNLPPQQVFAARLRVWDEYDQASSFTQVFRFVSPATPASLVETFQSAQWIGFDIPKPADTPWRETEPSLTAFDQAHWIAGNLGENQTGIFIRNFEWPANRTLRQATLLTSGDDHYTVSINGISSATGKELRKVTAQRITHTVFPGENRIEVRLHNQTGPHGFIAALILEDTDGLTEVVVTDPSWTFTNDTDTSPSSPARSLGPNGTAPWGKLTPAVLTKTYLPVTYLRHDFELDAPPTTAILHLTALGHVAPEINGQCADDALFSPGWTNPKKRLYIRSVEVTKLLQKGRNSIGLRLADGWFRGNISILGQNIHGTHTRTRAILEIHDADGRKTYIGTNGEWKANTGGILESDMQAGESFDANLEPADWSTPTFDDSSWSPVVVDDQVTTGPLLPQIAPPVRPVMELKARKITEPHPGVYIVDFGQNFAGKVRLKIKEARNTHIQLRFGEMLEANGHLYTENLRSARATDHYISSGHPTGESWEPLFTYHGFRYAEIRGLSQPPDLETLTAVVIRSHLPETGNFTCSDPLINQIHENTLWGLRSNYIEVPTDCPQRDERMGWSGDTQVFANTACYLMDSSAFLSKWLYDFEDARTSDGIYPAMAPVYHQMWSPGWSDAITVVPWQIHRHYGNLGPAADLLEGMQAHLDHYRRKAPNDIGPNEGFGDWLAVGEPTPKDLIATAYRAHSHRLTAQLATSLNQKDLAASHLKDFERIASSFRKTWVTADGKIGSDTQTGYLLALHFNLLTPEQEPLAASHLVAAIARRNNHLDTGFLGVNLLLPTLSKIGRTDLAYQLIQNRTYPSWGYSIDQGATTIWERWNSYTNENGFGDVSMNSFNHYAYGSCVEWLYETVLGIRPLEPGFRTFAIAPQPGGGLTHAKGSYQSTRGLISSSWTTTADGHHSLTVSIPPNTSALVTVPTQDPASIRIDDYPEDRKPLPIQENSATFRCLPGTYRFIYR